MKTTLITRSDLAAKPLEDFLVRNGHKVRNEPLITTLTIDSSQTDKEKINKASSIIVTSQNSYFALKHVKRKEDVKIFTIGHKGRYKLNQLGFHNIISLEEETDIKKLNSRGEALARLIAQSYNATGEPKNELTTKFEAKDKICDGDILYLRGEIISFDIAKYLASCQIAIEEVVCYKVRFLNNFSTNFIESTSFTKYDPVIIFSLLCAETFVDLTKRNNMVGYFLESKILCFSNRIKTFMQAKGFTNVGTFWDDKTLTDFYA